VSGKEAKGMNTQKSRKAFEEARRVLPGGVNSPVRAFRAVGGQPLFVKQGEGAWIEDVDGNRYVDYVCSWGPLILGHAHPEVVMALGERIGQGTSFGIPTELETALAKKVVRAIPSIEKVRFVNSGTEATMSAVRVARGYTGRSKVIKFEGCYHGHVDALLVKAGSGAATFGAPDSPGIPPAVTGDTLVLPFNDLEAVERVVDAYGPEVAGVLLEPVAGNMGLVSPKEGFLEGLRKITEKAGILLIFDEVITGFRLALGGAQEWFRIMPDLTCLGKILGGGMPVGAFGGREEIMGVLSPEGPVYQAGTLSGNPLAMQTGLATLEELERPGFHDSLNEKAQKFVRALEEVARETGGAARVQSIGSMFTVFFRSEPVVDFGTAAECDLERFATFHRGMLSEGVYWPPSQFETCFVSQAHEDKEFDKTLEAARKAFKS
jgi:glutamate-1-semialdehyde 2,1-aminomutase